MLPSLSLLRQQLQEIIGDKNRQGHVTDGLLDELLSVERTGSYDAMLAFARKVANLPMRPNWPYVEPSDLPGIREQSDPKRSTRPLVSLEPAKIAPQVEAAFLSSMCGCIVGKPIEGRLDLPQIRAALEHVGAWPLNDYVPEAALEPLGYRHPDWYKTVKERIEYVAADDDINYSLLGMLVLERHGATFTKNQLADLWIKQLPVFWCWGPERTFCINAAWWSVNHGPEFPFRDVEVPFDEWASVLNPKDEFCGALIRADAYGYAAAGHPELASALAWRDSSMTHHRTGIYGTMFVAAAIATAFVADQWEDIFRTALQYVPQRSRFAEIMSDCLAIVREAGDWLDGYAQVHARYGQYTGCQIYQELGMVMNSLRFAADIGQGICMQVSQGQDTDSFGCTCGSILGAFHGPAKLDARWLKPFNDTIYHALADCHEQKLSAVARRMGKLPARLAEDAAKA